MNAPASTVCARDGLPAAEVCSRCGLFVCPSCRRWQSEQLLCVGCRERLGERASPQARLALLLATVGLVVPPLGAAAVVLGQNELGRIRRCEVSDSGESHARLARGMGAVEVLLLLFVFVLLFLRFA